MPVTEIAEGAFNDANNSLRICCDVTYGIYETARRYAIDHEHIFIEMNTDTLPDHYHPDGVAK